MECGEFKIVSAKRTQFLVALEGFFCVAFLSSQSFQMQSFVFSARGFREVVQQRGF
jgi:hypothetical protein